MMKLLTLCFIICFNLQAQQSTIKKLWFKNKLLLLAKTYSGTADQDFKKQKSLEKVVAKLLKAAPQPPIKERLSLLHGTWKQVFGPYNYRKNDGSVDPTLGVKEIYQVIFAEGFYYNVAPLYPLGIKKQEKISLLRGEFKVTDNEKNLLSVQFTNYPGLSKRPENLDLWQIPELIENNEIEDTITIVPTFVVKWFFSKGSLREVYTDETLRITYGKSSKVGDKERIYILTKID